MENAAEITGVSKVYHIYDSPRDRLKELLSPTKKKYHREFHALEGVSLDIQRGETFGIIGRNGSGKSTLLKIICGIVKPTTGEVRTAGRISAILELGTGFDPLFTGRENAYLNGALMGFTKKEMDGCLPAIEEFADIGRFMDQPVRTYSSGMYVRLAFACAVNVNPDILVIDEAISVGDVFFVTKCYRKINEFKEQGKTIILVSHGMEAVQKNCDRALFLHAGKAVAVGETKEVINLYYETIQLRDRKPGSEAAPEPTSFSDGPTRNAPVEGVTDLCPSRPTYNKYEFRYGNSKASIVDYRMLGEDGKDMQFVYGGGRLRFVYEVYFHEHVRQPIYGFTIKTKDGVNVYTVNTLYEGVAVEPGMAGERVTVSFTQDINLIAGDYFISAGVAEAVGDGVVPADRRFDFALLKVMPVGMSTGVADLFSKIEVSKGPAA